MTKASELTKITLNLRTKDVSRARELARELSIPYQLVVRQWVAMGAAKKRRRADYA